jgi:hypothetical protein
VVLLDLKEHFNQKGPVIFLQTHIRTQVPIILTTMNIYMEKIMMKLMWIVLLFANFNTFAASMSNGIVCRLQAGNSFHLANKGLTHYKKMSHEECLQKGEELFNSPANIGWRFINPANNTITESLWETQYKVVKITYYSIDGEKFVSKLKRSSVYKVLKSKKRTKIQSGYRCWTDSDCVEVD